MIREFKRVAGWNEATGGLPFWMTVIIAAAVGIGLLAFGCLLIGLGVES